MAKRVQGLKADGTNNNLPSATTTIHTDFLGSPVAETNASGAVDKVERFTPYGEAADLQLDAGPGFTGHATDVATGLTYMQQRYYDPEIGRFLSPDPVGPEEDFINHFNRYNYALNNPMRYTDPDGGAPNRGGVTTGYAVYKYLQNGSLIDLANSHSGNVNRYFHTQKFGYVDVKHFAIAADMALKGSFESTIHIKAMVYEVRQWLEEWGDDYRSGFSNEDLPSAEAGIDFANSIMVGDSLATSFLNWATANGASVTVKGNSPGLGQLPAKDPSIRKTQTDGIEVRRVNGRIDAANQRDEDEAEKRRKDFLGF